MRRLVIPFAFIAVATTAAALTVSAPIASASTGAAAKAASGYDLENFASVPAGILKGKTQDVLDIRRLGLNGSGKPVGVTARVGSTGRVLWSDSLPEPFEGYVAIQPEIVGPSAKPGMLVETSSSTSKPSGAADYTLTVAAYAGTTGHRLWTQTFTGTETADGDMSGVPQYVGPLAQAHGGPTFLVALQSSAGSHDTTQLDQIAGSSSAFTELGSPVTAIGVFPSFMAVPGLSRDGVGDVMLLVNTIEAPYLSALNGASGQPLWTAAGVTADGVDPVESVGYFSSGQHVNVAVETYSASQASRVDILNGANGHVVLARDADYAVVIDKAGRHLVRALQLVSTDSSSTPKKVAAGLKVVAVTPSNKVLYTTRLSVSDRPLSHATDASGSAGATAVGDVQGDGALDDLADVSVSSSNPTTTRTKSRIGILDGRTGVFRELNATIAADGSLHKGSRTDFVAVDVKGGAVQLSAWRGSTRQPYYLSRTVAGVSGVKAAWVTSARVSGQHCSDVLLAAAGSSSGVLGVVDGAGHPLWTVKYKARQNTGGTLTTDKKPATPCA